ncbi:hypothetical protein AAES_147668 [Amazona aestiva]|uniref:Uncharacterized protein n=1 Tax=Amazona aestiva TaxID=12930 RepID=A0A0Q3LXB5_AMAAE|nr:hypothetical protein AAES_147668 [Amazona aestiva]
MRRHDKSLAAMKEVHRAPEVSDQLWVQCPKGRAEIWGVIKASTSAVSTADRGQGEITMLVVSLSISVLEKPEIMVGGQKKSSLCFSWQKELEIG